MVSPAEVQLIAWIKSEFIHRTLAVRCGGSSLDWIATADGSHWQKIQAKAKELGIEQTEDDLQEWLGAVRNWSRWHEVINHMDMDALEHEMKERTSTIKPATDLSGKADHSCR